MKNTIGLKRSRLFICSPVGLDFFKGLAGGLRDAFPHYEEVRDAHGGEEEECAGRGERLQHPRSELTDQVGSDPEGEAGDAHRKAAHPVRVHLGEQHEDHSTARRSLP